MCGIAGFQGRFDEELLARMSELVAHRGPDDSSQVILGTGDQLSGLAHRRLSIIDLSAEGKQPMTVRCDRCGCHSLQDLSLTYNGEIYNYRQLRRELESKGHNFHSHTDSEVLLHLWAEAGLEMFERLNGIYAFGLRDGRTSGRPQSVVAGDVLLARDQLGVKPLYYTENTRGVVFASEMKALLTDPRISRELDAAAIQETIAHLWTPAPRTVLKHVKKLPPGSAMIVRSGRIHRLWQYYELPYGREWVADSEADIAAHVRSLVGEAVDRQMMADVPMGAFLSGGLDSSAVVAMMKRARPGDRPVCYAIGFHGDDQIEGAAADMPYARKVARHLDVELRELTVGPEIIGGLERMLYHLDEPQADPAPLHVLHIAEHARADGIEVLLSGAGGDDIFSGYRRHQALRLDPFWNALPHPVRRMLAGWARHAESDGSALNAMLPSMRRVFKGVANVDRSIDERLVGYFAWNTTQLRRSLLSPDIAAATETLAAGAPLLESLARIPHERSALNRMLYLETKHFLADHNLNYTDKMGMAAGVEIRVPLLDLELVDYATRIPPHLKQKGRIGKAIFKRAMEPVLPHDVIYRRKTGFGAPLRRWLRIELRDMVEDVLSESALRRRGLFEPRAVRRLIDLDRSGRIDGAYTIFALLCIELWCTLFVDQPAISSPPMRVPAAS